MPKTLLQWANEMTGGSTDDPVVAFEQWDNERAALLELHDENQAYSILNRRLWVVIELAYNTLAKVENDANMFLTEPTRKRIAEFREQYEKLNVNKTLSNDMNTRKDKSNGS